MSEPRPSNLAVWFAALGGAGAWAVQFVANLFLTYAECNHPGGGSVPLHGWELALSAVAIAIALGAEAVSIRLFRRSWRLDGVIDAEILGNGGPPPVGRIAFLSMVGITVNFLALAIVAMTAIGAPLLPLCQQS